MLFNGSKSRTGTELTDYQKRIEVTDNVILCVAQVEHMINSIGSRIREELSNIDKPFVEKRRKKKAPWADRRNFFKR